MAQSTGSVMSEMRQLVQMFQEQMLQMQERHEAQLQHILAKTTTSVHLPSFTAFDSSKELWRDYWARFTTFAAAQSIPEEKISQIFLTSQDPSIYKLLNTLANQENPARELNTLTMEEINPNPCHLHGGPVPSKTLCGEREIQILVRDEQETRRKRP